MTPSRSLITFAFSCIAALVLPAAAGALDPGGIDEYIACQEGDGGAVGECVPVYVQCNDDIDNDGDGLNNLEDPGCRNRYDDLEEPQCDDTYDNDGDGSADFAGSGVLPADDDCQTPWWDDESISRLEKTGLPNDGHGGVGKMTECGEIDWGLGGVALLVPPLVRLRRRRSKR